MNANENLSPMVVAKLMKDIRALCTAPPKGITVYFSEDNISNITADIDGPEDTPFEGGVFKVKLVLGPDFPQQPPKGYFVTKIFHPNVSESGEICVNTLKKDWKAEHTLEHVLIVIRCLLIVPNAESALNPEAGRLLLEAYDDFAARAAMMTRIHAKPPKDCAPSSPKKKNADELKSCGSPSKKLKSKPADKPAVAAKKASLKRL